MRAMGIYYALGAVAVAAAGAGVTILAYPELLPPALRLPAAAAPSKPAPPAPSPVASAKPAPAPRAEPTPGFDIVRVERDGSAVIAGHAAPGDRIELRDADKLLGTVVADDNGQFVIIPDPLAAGAHALRLAAVSAKGEPRLSAPSQLEVATAAAAPAPKPAPAVAVVAARTPSSPLPSATPTPTQSQAALAPAPSPEARATPPSAAPTLAALSLSRLAVARVKATEPGRLEAEGEAEPGAKLRLTLNGAYLADVAAGVDGRWSLTIEHGMTPGLYALEARNLAAPASPPARAAFAYPQNPTPDGAALVAAKAVEPVAPASPVMSALAPPPAASPAPAAAAPEPARTDAPAPAVALTTPSPAPAAPAPAAPDPSHAVVAQVRTTTVVPGDNLWDLARKFYNDGTRYSDIYAANSDQIRNPSLIFVGQVFVVPSGAPTKP